MLVVGPAAVTRQPLPPSFTSSFNYDRTAVIEDRAVEIDGRRVLHQVRVHGVAAGEHTARDHDDVADLERADILLCQRRIERDFLARYA